MEYTIVNRKYYLMSKYTFQITFASLLIISLFIVGCGLDDDSPGSVTLKIDVPASIDTSQDDTLKLTVSTDFKTDESDSAKIIFNTKEEYKITEDYEQTFTLDSEEPKFAFEIVNPWSESVKLTVQYEGDDPSDVTIRPNGHYSSTYQQTTVDILP